MSIFFPAIGLATSAVAIKKITQKQFLSAAEALSEKSRPNLFPPLTELREVTKYIAIQVIKTARSEGLTGKISDEEIEEAVEKVMWFPNYPDYTV